MKKIILAFDGAHFSKGAFDFARQLNELEPILLTGVFLPQVDFSRAWNYANGGASVMLPIVEDYNADLIEENVRVFELECKRYSIEYRVHKNRLDFAMPELRKETRFADLMILGSERFYQNLGIETPNQYLKMALHEAECPVMLSPENFHFPESVVLSYDGSEDATFAIKSFTCLFPELCSRKTILVYASAKTHPEMPEIDYMKELVSRHFPNLTLHLLEGKPKKYFGNWIHEIKNPVLVSGSFGRSGLSEVFKPSFVSEVINEHKIPVFIAHR